jgi:hypothetical protein
LTPVNCNIPSSFNHHSLSPSNSIVTTHLSNNFVNSREFVNKLAGFLCVLTLRFIYLYRHPDILRSNDNSDIKLISLNIVMS